MKSPMSAQQSDAIARSSWLFAAVAFVLFIAGFWQQPFIDFESRFALFAQEMLRHGPQFFPTTYGQPYPDYPVTGTLLIWLCSLPFGEVTKFSAILPTAIVSALNFALLYRLLAPYSRQWALMAMCLQAMTLMFLAEARSISLDQMVATITLLGVLALDVAQRYTDIAAKKKTLRWLPLILFVGFLIRGPLGVVIPAAAMCAYCVAMNNRPHLWRVMLTAIIVLALAWGAMLAITAHLYGAAFMHDVARMQVFGRLESKGAAQPLQYFTSSFGNYAPVYPFAIVVSAVAAKRIFIDKSTPIDRVLFALILWTLIVMIGMSIPHVKKARYILAVVPALSAISAYPWSDRAVVALSGLKKGIERFFTLLPLLIIAALAIIHHRTKHHHGDVRVSLTTIYVLLAAIQVIAAWIYYKYIGQLRSVLLAAAAAAAIWCTYVFAVEPIMRQLHDTANFTAQTEALRARNPGALVLFGMTKDGEAIKYLVNTPHDLSPIFARDKQDLATAPRPCYVMINDRDIDAVTDELPQQTRVLSAHFDGHPFSVFYLAP